ncbi:hypothetical protein EG240_09680 [Paenimyroides tangerinum]|uniref:Cytochrome c domain-containing protein n=1 Tax=Paenimyroides tangerinum TaxID=2488728 RepID=A0A3P3W569_9FLAO|nr:cytochrome c [Paenimyroides tangerinum]RRJ90130.1 hypothetical protein EG240_09680 [Paenimyroides tangerinum]
MKKILLIILIILGLLIVYELFKEEISNKLNQNHTEYIDTIEVNPVEPRTNQVTNQISTTDTSLGKSIFRENCAPCHKLDEDMIGPKLSKIDSLTYFNWLTNEDFEKSNQGKGLSMTKHHFNYSSNLTKEEINSIYTYLKQNE